MSTGLSRQATKESIAQSQAAVPVACVDFSDVNPIGGAFCAVLVEKPRVSRGFVRQSFNGGPHITL